MRQGFNFAFMPHLQWLFEVGGIPYVWGVAFFEAGLSTMWPVTAR
jgi:hypothetical protein